MLKFRNSVSFAAKAFVMRQSRNYEKSHNSTAYITFLLYLCVIKVKEL